MSAAIREIRRLYPTAHITLLVGKSALSMAEFCPYIDNIVTLAKHNRDKNFAKSYQDMFEIAKHLLKRKIDIAFNFGQFPASQLLAYMSGAREIVVRRFFVDLAQISMASGLPWIFFSTFATFTSDLKDLEDPHFNEIHLYILQNYTRTQIVNKKLELWLSPIDKFKAEVNLCRFTDKKIYALSMGGAQRQLCKRYPPEYYAELIKMILTEEAAIFIILGGNQDIESGNIVKSIVNSDSVKDFTNQLTLRESAAFLSFCDYYIGNDTGMMHAAAALGIPVLSPNCFPADMEMNNMSSPQRFYPYGVPSVIVQPQHALSECKENVMAKFFTGCVANESHCIKQISPQTLFQGLQILKQAVKNGEKELTFLA
ncbi:MAG: glycosyltransferase family 9 protein [Selenomonadaceae bacterium]|nr:glycosyltransferase family 9 protein [Selenomonadaceae bacterium]